MFFTAVFKAAGAVIDLVPKPVYAIVVIGLTAVNFSTLHDLSSEQRAHDKTRVTLAEEREDIAIERANNSTLLAKAEKIAREEEARLKSEHLEYRKVADAQNQTSSARADRLVGQLRSAETRVLAARAMSGPAATPITAETGAVCGAAGIPAHVGEADVREAQRADLIRTELLFCYAAYDGAERAIRSYAERVKALNP